MSDIVYINGTYVQKDDAKISVFDRGLLFSDSIYEVVAIRNGIFYDQDAHLARLKRSLDALKILVCSQILSGLIQSIKDLAKKNNIENGLVYIQITAGTEDNRNFLRAKNTKPTIIMFVQHKTLGEINPITVVTLPDTRWKKCNIKTTQLLSATLASIDAKEHGADNAWLYDQDGNITEGISSNAFIIKDGSIITRNLREDILPGITRQSVLSFAGDINIKQQAFTVQEAEQADEAFVTSATTFVAPVIKINDNVIGSGNIGPITEKLSLLYLKQMEKNKND